MFSREDILEQLRKGADASDIAQKMADAINGALSDFEAEKEKAKEAEAKKEKEMRTDAGKIVDLMTGFYNKYFGEIELNKEEREALVDAVLGISRDAMKEIERINKVTKGMQDIFGAPSAEKEIDDEALRRFLATL